jgi:DNA-directed RNA polymerase specialized sigma24 family protein
MSNNLSYEQWEWLEEKYGKLLHHIAYRIGLDPITHDHDDSYQELCIAMMDTVKMFDKTASVSFEEYKETAHFDKYLKTVLWNRKNCLGQKIIRRAPLRRQVTIDEKLLKDKVFSPVESFTPFGNESLDEDMLNILNEVEQDAKIIKPSGDFNISRLCRNLDKSKAEVKHTIERLQHTLKSYDE